MYPVTTLWQVFCKLSNLNIEYLNLEFNSYSLTLLVTMSTSYRPPLYHIFLCKLHSSQFLAKCILLEICLVCLVYLPFLAMQIADFLSNIMGGACSGTTYGFLFNNSLFGIMKFVRSIPSVRAELYSLSALFCGPGTGKCVQISMDPP